MSCGAREWAQATTARDQKAQRRWKRLLGKIDKLHGDEGSRCTEVRVTLVALMLGRSGETVHRVHLPAGCDACVAGCACF